MPELLCVFALMLSTTVSAVGMGGINVVSALGQPLKAEIELVAISKAEQESLGARLAAPEAYKNAGLEYPVNNKFKFQIESRANGQLFIKASSDQPVNDPFVSLLVELTWPAGKLTREYTFLLDPPGYVPEQPAQAEVQAVAPEVQAVTPEVETPAPEVTSSTTPAVPEEVVPSPTEQVAPVVAVKPTEPAEPVEQAKPAEPVKLVEKPKPVTAIKQAGKTATKSAAGLASEVSLTVKRGDTATKIAEQYKPTDMSLERMLVAIYRANADQFDSKNMNRIRAGKILRLPTQQEMNSVSLPDAVKEIRAQAADWNAYRQKLASAASASNQSQAVQQVATGKISSSIADKAPVAKESAKEVLKLSKGEAPGDQAGKNAGGKALSGQDKKNAEQEDAIAKSKSLKEEQERTALLEKNIKDMQRLAQLKAETAALAQPPAAAAKDAAGGVTASSAVTPTPVVPPKPKQVQPEPSLIDQVLDEPLYQVAGAGALIFVGGLGFMLYRRKRNPANRVNPHQAEVVGETTSNITAPVVPSPDTGDFTVYTAAMEVETPQSDSVDPISEADLFLNFGRDAQAEEILKEALQNTPNNHQIHLKLLGIYANRKDVSSFATIAKQLQDSGDEEAWQKALAMGNKLDPNNPMYSGARTIEDASSATMQVAAFAATPEPEKVPKAQASALDFDFDVGHSATDEAASPERDFLADAKSSGESPDGERADNSGNMDFDVTSTHPSILAFGEPIKAEAPALDGLAFDVTGSHTLKAKVAPPEIQTPFDTDDGIPFKLDFPVENPAGKTSSAPQPAAVGLAGISLNFDDGAAVPVASTNKDDHWQEVATKIDLAKAYHEMGDASGAREILEEVLREGDDEQREAAKNIIEQLG